MLLKVMERYFFKKQNPSLNMKKEIISFLFLIFLIPLISAFSFSDVFSYIDAQSIFILVCFGVLGLLLSVILNRFPAFQGKTAGLMSLLLSLGMTYGINKWLNVNSVFSSFGLSTDLIVYLPLILLIIFIISIFVFKCKTFLITGLLLIIISTFTDWVYETIIVLTAGIIFVLIWLICAFLRWRKKRSLPPAVINGIRRLIIEARAYRQWADSQSNPKIYRNWAHFINYLKGRGYGRNENEICQRMSVTPKNISDVVKKYIN